MAFVVTKEKVVLWPVSVRVPVDGGGVTVQTFKAKFSIIDKTRVEELTEEARANLDRRSQGVDGGETGVDVLVLREAIKDMLELVDEDKQPVAYSDDIRDALIGIPYVRLGLWDAYVAASQGRKTKN